MTVALLVAAGVAQNSPKVSLDTSETLFTVLTAINTCGYDQDLNASDPLRSQVRGEVGKNIKAADATRETVRLMCESYNERQQPDPSRTLAQYVSLALYLNPPPALTPKVKESDLPPDAQSVLGLVPLLEKFYEQAGLHAIWMRHQDAYDGLSQRYHEPLSKVLFDTEIYLKLPSSVYLGRQFTVYLDPMGAPAQTNARNYGSDYFVVISPATGSSLKMEQIRHTYLHYLLDPLALKYPAHMKRLEPLLDVVKTAPMDEGFKNDTSLMVTECLIRAIEARTMPGGKTSDPQREKTVEDSVEQGFILTRYFYDSLIAFEKEPTGIRNAYGEMLSSIDIGREEKRASQIQFAGQASPELLHLSRPMEGKLLMTAQQRLAAGDTEAAQKLAQEALDEKSEDPGRALFILAQVSTANGDMQGARGYFQRTLEVAQEPKVVAWSHIYLGRISDIQQDRPSALEHYHAALSAGADLPEAKAAAERGIQQPFEPPAHPQPQ